MFILGIQMMQIVSLGLPGNNSGATYRRSMEESIALIHTLTTGVCWHNHSNNCQVIANHSSPKLSDRKMVGSMCLLCTFSGVKVYHLVLDSIHRCGHEYYQVIAGLMYLQQSTPRNQLLLLTKLNIWDTL